SQTYTLFPYTTLFRSDFRPFIQMLSKAQIRVILLHKFKLGHNTADATRNVNRAWGDGTASDRTTRRWFEKFRNGDTNLEDEEGRSEEHTSELQSRFDL